MTNKGRKAKRNGGKPPKRAGRPKTAEKVQDIKAMVSQMAKAAIKSQMTGYQGNSSVLGNLGMAAGNGISKIFGLGAYTLNQNSLYDVKTGSQVPFMHSSDESVVLRHREYIGDISSSTGFNATKFQVNPGLATTFPYLSAIASSFQEYRFRGLIFEFKSTSAVALVNGTNTAMGNVMMAAQYRADAPTFTNKVEMLNEMWSVDTRTSENLILPIECDPRENAMDIQYVRTAGSTGDIKLYDLCNVVIATQGAPAVSVIGELWVSYEVQFFKPALTPTGGVIAAFSAQADGSAVLPLGVASTQVILTDTFPIISLNANQITLAPFTTGNYQLLVYHFGAAALYAPGAVTFPANVTFLSIISGGGVGNAPNVGVNSTDCIQSAYLSIAPVAANTVINIANGVYPANGAVEIFLIELPDSFN